MDILYILAFVGIGSIITYLAGNKWAKSVALVFALLALGVLCKLLFQGNFTKISVFHTWFQNPNIDFDLLLNGNSLIFVLLTLVAVPIIIAASSVQQVSNQKSFFALVLMMEFALLGTFLANNAILFYIFWELALIPIYFIALLWGDENRKQATLTFFLYTFIGSLFLLIGLILVAYYPALALYYSTFVFLSIFIAFAVKIPIFPFHSWQANVYQSAPMVGSMLLSGVMLKMGFWGIFRWMLPYVDKDILYCNKTQHIILALALFGVLYGALLAIKQNNLKRLLAYSSFSHVGLIAMGLFVMNVSGLKGMFIQSFAHGINIIGLFYIAQIIYQRTHTFSIKELGGIWQKAPIFSAFSLVIVLASISMPLTNAFVGEFMLLNGIFQYHWIVALVASLAVILGAVYMLRMFQYAFLGKPNQQTENFKDVSVVECILLTIITLIIFITGIAPNLLLQFIS